MSIKDHLVRNKWIYSVGLAVIVGFYAYIHIFSGIPNTERVSGDFSKIFLKEAGKGLNPEVLDIGSGEGDGGNVYMHVKFNVIADSDTELKTGWFAGQHLRKGERIKNQNAWILYQDLSGTEWKLSGYGLTTNGKMQN